MAEKGGNHRPKNAREVPHVESVEDILHLKMVQLSILAKDWSVDLTGLSELNSMQEKMIKFWMDRQQGDTSSETSDLASAFYEHKKTRMALHEKYKNAKKLYENFTKKIQSNLKQSHNDVLTTIKERKESLKSGECTIVIAGEVGAGKSSLLNLILETQIFPTDPLRCTNTIVEIRSSEKREAIFYYKRKISDSGKKVKIAPKIINLKHLNDIQEFKDCVAEGDASEDDNPYERCEVTYPFKSLSKGVVIVDTPGIEGGSNVDQRLHTYLSKAFGFIYVINTNTAGGVQESRLGHLLKTVVNESEEFSPETSLFIGNKWEHVPEQDRVAVQQNIFYKLNQVYPGVRQSQIHYMSVKKAFEFNLKYNTRLEEHKVLSTKVGELLPSSLRQGMISHYWWLSSFLARSLYLLRVTGVQQAMTRVELGRQFETLRKHVTDLQKNTDESISRLRFRVEYDVKNIIIDVQHTLQDKTFINRLCDWKDTAEQLKPEKTWKKTADAAAVKISERISREIDGWEKQKGVLQVVNDEIISVFRKELGLMDDQIKELEEYLVNSHKGSMCQTIRVESVKTLFFRRKKKIEKTYSTLGGAVSCLGMLNTDKKKVRNLFKKDFDETTQAKKMAEATELYVETILSHKEFEEKLRKFFERYFKDIDEASKRIPGFLKADQQLIETLRTSIEEEDRLKEKLPELVHESSELLGKLDIFYVKNIMKFDFDSSELDLDNQRELGTGTFAKVFRTKIKRKDRTVAIKVANDEVNLTNVTDILAEDRTMRDLRHENIVRYYGASFVKTSRGLQWIMVMELCQTTLKNMYTGRQRNERLIPGCLGNDHPRYDEAAKYMLDHAYQICLGLEYIHEKGYTHRDMKLENVLIADGNVVKITDVGVTKATKMLAQTGMGSPAYMAPEVLLADRAQTNKVDIYSFSIMFWEMWYGKDIAEEIATRCLGYGVSGNPMDELKHHIAKPDGWRPSLSASSKGPPELITDVLKKGWAFEPEMRPSAKIFGNTLKNVIENQF